MGSILMHLTISEKVRVKYNLSENFLVGAIAPDILKMVTSRKNSHYIDKYVFDNEVRYLPNIDKFLSQNNLENDDYFLGYLSHLVQDRIWFNNYIPMIAKRHEYNQIIYTKDGLVHSEEDFKNDIYNDYIMVQDQLNSIVKIDLNNIRNCAKEYFNDKKISDIIDKQVIYYESIKNGKNILINSEFLSKYINQGISETEEYILKLQNLA